MNMIVFGEVKVFKYYVGIVIDPNFGIESLGVCF